MSRVEVVIPCYNYGRFLQKAATSVLQQSGVDVRIVIVDDASSDDTPAVCAALAADNRVSILRHDENRGHIVTYNEGIDRATSDYLLILSADDYLAKGALARAVRIFNADEKIGLVYGSFARFNPADKYPFRMTSPWGDSPPQQSFALEALEHGSESASVLDPAQLICALAEANHISTATAVVRTSVQKQIGHYRVDLPHSADLEMWLRFALESRVAYVDHLQAIFRYHGANMQLGYHGTPDIVQCIAAFEPHLGEIALRLEDGHSLAAHIRRTLKARAFKIALKELKHFRIAAGLRALVLAAGQ